MIYHGKGPGDSLVDLPETVTKTLDALRPVRQRFDSIAVTGMSGVIVGAPVALRMNKPLVVLRKPYERGHSRTHIGLDQVGKRVLFLDDFVAGGDTRARVREQIAKHAKADLVGTYLYRDNELSFDD